VEEVTKATQLIVMNQDARSDVAELQSPGSKAPSQVAVGG
jgi:hypothetical protein